MKVSAWIFQESKGQTKNPNAKTMKVIELGLAFFLYY